MDGDGKNASTSQDKLQSDLCSICLQKIENKVFVDQCLHMFCKKCLLKWVKVKPECPLCKQGITKILHNVKSECDYDVMTLGELFGSEVVLDALQVVNANAISDEAHEELERMLSASHSVGSDGASTSQDVRNKISDFRRHIYEEGLWITSVRGDNSETNIFRRNIYCVSRLLRWLSRELSFIMENSDVDSSFVIELILTLIPLYHIKSEEFYSHIHPFLRSYTRQFLNEFFYFANSTQPIEIFDRLAIYSHRPGELTPIASPDPVPNSSENETIQKTASSEHEKTSNFSQPTFESQNLAFLSKPSTSGAQNNPQNLQKVSNQEIGKSKVKVNLNDNKEKEEDHRCETVEILKPKSQRTYKVIDLTSDEKIDNNCSVSNVAYTHVTDPVSDDDKISTIKDKGNSLAINQLLDQGNESVTRESNCQSEQPSTSNGRNKESNLLKPPNYSSLQSNLPSMLDEFVSFFHAKLAESNISISDILNNCSPRNYTTPSRVSNEHQYPSSNNPHRQCKEKQGESSKRKRLQPVSENLELRSDDATASSNYDHDDHQKDSSSSESSKCEKQEKGHSEHKRKCLHRRDNSEE